MKSLHNFLVNNHVNPSAKPETDVVYANVTFQEFKDKLTYLVKEYNKFVGNGVSPQNAQKYDDVEKGFQLFFKKTELKAIKWFLKGKEHKSGIYIKFTDGTILQVSRYENSHYVTISVIVTNDYKWGNSNDWSNAIKLEQMYDGETMDYLYFLFITRLYKNLVK